MKTIQLYSQNDIIKSKLGTLFMISHVHDAMQEAVKHAFKIDFFKYYAQRLEVKNDMKIGGDFGNVLMKSPGDKTLLLHPEMVTIHDDFNGNFTYVGTLEEVKAAYGIKHYRSVYGMRTEDGRAIA